MTTEPKTALQIATAFIERMSKLDCGGHCEFSARGAREALAAMRAAPGPCPDCRGGIRELAGNFWRCGTCRGIGELTADQREKAGLR